MASGFKAFVPSVATTYRHTRQDIGGLDLRDAPDTAAMRAASNVIPLRGGAVTVAGASLPTGNPFATPISVHSLGDGLLVIYAESNGIYATYTCGDVSAVAKISDDTDNTAHRSVARFNRYSNPADALSGTYARYALIYPDKVMFDIDVASAGELTLEDIDESVGQTPNMTNVCVHLSRLFGTDNDRVYASAFNDFRDFELDTVSDVSSGNAWATTSQSNTKGDGAFTASVVYDGHVMCFKRDFCHIINNNKNPFRIADLACVGCVSAPSIAEVDGTLYFAAKNGIYAFSGGTPRCVSAPLGNISFDGSVGAEHEGKYYVYVPERSEVFVYDPVLSRYGEISVISPIVSMAEHEGKLYALYADGMLSVLDGDICAHWSLETSLILGGADEARRVKRLLVSVTLEGGAYIDGYIVDASGAKRKIFSGSTSGTHTYRARIRGYASDGHRICLSGYGRATVHGITLEYGDTK